MLFYVSRIAYYTASDFNFTAIFLKDLFEIVTNAKWFTDEDNVPFFMTDSVIGVDSRVSSKKGPYLQVHTGSANMYGRVSSKVYVVMMAVLSNGIITSL